MAEQRILWAKSEEESLRKVQEAGVKINYPDKKPFAKKVEGMLAEYEKKPELYKLIQRIRAVE